MDIGKVLGEIQSSALKEVVKGLHNVIERVQEGDIKFKQGAVELAGYKHIIQSLALDWMFNKQKKLLR